MGSRWHHLPDAGLGFVVVWTQHARMARVVVEAHSSTQGGWHAVQDKLLSGEASHQVVFATACHQDIRRSSWAVVEVVRCCPFHEVRCEGAVAGGSSRLRKGRYTAKAVLDHHYAVSEKAACHSYTAEDPCRDAVRRLWVLQEGDQTTEVGVGIQVRRAAEGRCARPAGPHSSAVAENRVDYWVLEASRRGSVRQAPDTVQ